MEFRKTIKEDINEVMRIIKQAQDYLKLKRIDQWQNNYPNKEVIEEDIKKDGSYVLLKDNKIIGTIAIFFEADENYNNIYEGTWISNDKYVVIHRIAVDNEYKGEGLASEILKNIESICLENKVYSIKADTHEENESMQKLLRKNNFKYCGVIYLKDRSKRIVFEKILKLIDKSNKE